MSTNMPQAARMRFSAGTGAGCPAAVICSALIREGARLHHEAGQPEPLDETVSALI